ncbi:Synaptotagmin-like protein 2 [Tupaia chinensis]|uniref:Synaptotagmin-like protein 2 n=1 Tax=Tupaia chinensis TaxID=246437 RepID=L9L167_TUPCH|nr:Synaptotagmin-like protein 2 [Tupaia chinensis]
MIDLSFLTEEEQETIMKVLQRDAALKRAEEERVRHLPEKIKDDQQLKNMSGQWFYEAKAKRHSDKIHGADIIRASMRRKKPLVAAEQSKDRANEAKESWVNNVNKDAFLPPELAGDVEEPEEDAAPASPSASVRNPASTVIDTSQENTKKSTASPVKQRKNPFNSSNLPEDHLLQQTKNEQPKNGRTGLLQTSKEDELPETKGKSTVPDTSSLPSPVDGTQIKAPIPKARKMINKSKDLKQDDNQSFPRQRTDSLNAKGVPRGILKRNSSSSSTDSETLRFNHNLEPKSKIVAPGLTIHERIPEKDHSLEDDSSPNSPEPLKHVRFSATKDELPQNPGLIQGREVGEFSVLESDSLKNGTEAAGDLNEFENDPKPSPLPFHLSASSPSTLKNKTDQSVTSGSFSINGLPLPSEILIAGSQSTENVSTISEHKAKPSELTVPESELPQSSAEKHFYVADELSLSVEPVEPEPSQVLDHSSRDHQQGKTPRLMALRAKTSSHCDPYATEIRKTPDDSISKVLDWFHRSSHSGDNKPSLQHLHEIEPKEKMDSKSQVTVALVTDDTQIKENDSKALSSTKVELKAVRSDSANQIDRDKLLSGNCQDNDMNNKSTSLHLSQQSLPNEDSGILQPFGKYSTPSQGTENVDYSQGSKSTGEGTGVPVSTTNFNFLKGADAEKQVPCNTKSIDNLAEEEPEARVHGNNRGNSEVNFNSSAVVKEPSLQDNISTERMSKGGNAYTAKTSLEPENTESLPGAANNRSTWKKPEVHLQEETGKVPKNQVQKEKYKRVSDRIAFWEGEKAAAKLTHKEPISSCSLDQPSAKAHQSIKSQGMSMDSAAIGQVEDNQVTAKRVVIDEDEQVSQLSRFYSSNKPEETRPEISSSSKNCPSADQSRKRSLLQTKINEPIGRLPVAGSIDSKRNIALLELQPPSNGENETCTHLEENRSLIGESNANFKIMSLKERMDESNTEQIYNHSQFEHLRKFWDSGAKLNSKDNNEKIITTVNQKSSVPLNSQKHKEFCDLKSPGKNAHRVEELLSQRKIMSRQEVERLNSECMLQVLPDETTLPLKPPRKYTHHLPGNESSKENVEKNTELVITPVFKEEKNCSDQEIQEFIVKTSVLSRDYKDSFNDSLQKLLSEVSLPMIQTSGGKVHGKPELKPSVPENRTWPQTSDFADTEKKAKGPKEITNEHVDKTVAPARVKQNTLIAGLEKLKEATGSSSPLQTNLEPDTTKTNSGSEEGRLFEKRTEQSHSSSAHPREIIIPSPERDETSENTAYTQEVKSGECQLNTENLRSEVGEGLHLSNQPSFLHRKSSLGDVPNSPQDRPFSQDAHLASQERALPSQREISETVEKVILVPKPVLKDVYATLRKLQREAWLVSSAGREVGPGEMEAELPEKREAAGSPPSPLGVTTSWATMDTVVSDRKNFYCIDVVSDKTHKVVSHLAAQPSPSEQTLSLPTSPVAQYGKELPQEVAEIMRETIIPPRSEFLEFSAGLEKLLKETMEISPSKYESDPGSLFLSELMDSIEKPRQAASESHPVEIKELVEKTQAPSVIESTFAIGFEKLLKETSESPLGQLQVSGKEETPRMKSSQSEQARGLKTVPHLYWASSEASEMKVKSIGSESQVNQCDNVLEGYKAVTDLSVDLCGSESGVEIPRTPQLYVGHEVGTLETLKPPENRGNESEAVERKRAFQEPDLEEAPEAISLFRNRKPIALLQTKEDPTKTRKVELILTSPYKRQEKEEEKGDFSESDFSDENTSSNAESWRNTSSSEEEPNPVLKTLKRNAARKMPSKSLEDISSDSSNQAKVDNLPEELVSGSVMSVYSGDFGNLEVKGNIQFAVDYVESLKELHVFVAQCKDLAAADVKKQRSDPYVKTYLLPDKGKMGKKKTLVVKKTLNPVYNEILRYKVEKQILKTQKLNLSVWHRDTFKRNSFLGEVELDLETWDWDNKQNKQLRWYPLKRKTAPVALETENRGEMKLALQYVPEPIPGKSYGTEVDWMDSTSEEVALWEKMVNSPNTWIEATLPLRMLLIAKISK